MVVPRPVAILRACASAAIAARRPGLRPSLDRGVGDGVPNFGDHVPRRVGGRAAASSTRRLRRPRSNLIFRPHRHDPAAPQETECPNSAAVTAVFRPANISTVHRAIATTEGRSRRHPDSGSRAWWLGIGSAPRKRVRREQAPARRFALTAWCRFAASETSALMCSYDSG